jgi:hypothetical protein
LHTDKEIDLRHRKKLNIMKGMQKYELKGVVGEGAYGKVFMARNKETGDTGKSKFNWTIFKFKPILMF